MRFRRAIASKLILQPSRHPLEVESLRRVEFEGGLGLLEAYVGHWHGDFGQHAGKPLDLLVLKLPGTAGRAERSTPFPAHLMEGQHAEIWTWNAPGYGRSSGPASLGAMGPAVLDFYDHVVPRVADSETRIWVNGNSLGCVISLYLASQRAVDGLVLRNPPPLVDLVAARNAWWNFGLGGSLVSGWIPAEMDAMQTASRVSQPTVFIESTADSLVTPAMQAEIRKVHQGPQRLLQLEGAEHHTPIDDCYFDELRGHLQWMWEQPTTA